MRKKRSKRPRIIDRRVQEPQKMPAPTRHLPGSKAKVKILQIRYMMHQQLWNEKDAQINLD